MDIVNHILAKYGLSLDKPIPHRATWMLPYPNPHLGDIIEARKCPWCNIPFDKRSSMGKHIQTYHHRTKNLKKSTCWQDLSKVNTQWAFKITRDRKGLYKIQNPLPTSQTPSTTHNLGELPLILTPSGPFIPNFYQALYWTEWMDKIKGNQAWTSSLMKVVFGLVELPSKAKSEVKDPKRAKLEAGLLRLHKTLQSYLSSADIWLDAYHHSLRERLKGR